jgi:DNA replication protein DnaC
MAKRMGLKQLAQKTYTLVDGLQPALAASIGEIEDSFDAIIYGPSGSGKTNCMVLIVKALLLALPKAKAEYISYEEGMGKTVQDLMIKRHNMLELVASRLTITDHLTYDELYKLMNKRQSPKIWVIDSIQASRFTYPQIQQLKEDFIMSKKKKIILYVSWAEGKNPQGAAAKSVEYYANIKMRVEHLIMFPKSRYGGNMPFVIHEPGARERWGKAFNKTAQIIKQPKAVQP